MRGDAARLQPARAWHHAVVWTVLVAVPAAKSIQVLASSDRACRREAGLAPVVVGDGGPMSHVLVRQGLLLAVVVLASFAVVERSSLGEGRHRIAGRGRWATAVGLRSDPARAARVGSIPSLGWIAVPILLSLMGTAVVLALRDEPSPVVRGDLLELVVVTAFAEELLFRGCLLAAAYRVLRPVAADVATAVSFAAWHVGDAWNDTLCSTGWARVIEVGATMVVTFAGGLLFAFVRRRSGNLAGPVYAHVATNLPGLVLGS